MSGLPPTSAADLARLQADWVQVATTADTLTGWANQMARMRAEQERLRAAGLWRSGGRTLLRALGVHEHEVLMCRGLAWLLTPDGWHGLGSSVLDGLLTLVGAPTHRSGEAVVVVEEARGDTRADIVVRFGGVTVLVEAKVLAGEQQAQADRLADGWGEEAPHLVFLTRSGHLPHTAQTSRGRWVPVTWAQVGQVVADAVQAHPGCAPGAREFADTVRFYGGSGA